MTNHAVLLLGLILACSVSDSRAAEVEQCSVTASEVLKDCGIKDVLEANIFAWAASGSKVSRVALTGRRDSKHVLIIAVRDPDSTDPRVQRWSIPRASIMLGDGKKLWDRWVFGRREYERAPTKDDLLGVCRELNWPKLQEQWVFVPSDAKAEADLVPFSEADKYGFKDARGNIVVKPIYDEVRRFSHGLAAVNLGAKYDYAMNVMNPMIKRGGKWGFIDVQGKVIVPITLEYVWDFSDGLVRVYDERGTRYLDPAGKVVVDLGQVDSPTDFSEGLAAVHEDQTQAGKGRVTKYIDKNGRTAMVVPGTADAFHDGMALLAVYQAKPDPTISIGHSLYGYIDRTGKVVIPPRFAVACEFHEGLAAVQAKNTGVQDKENSWGYIDKSGRFVIEPQFNQAQPFRKGVARVHVGGILRTYPDTVPFWEGGQWQSIDRAGKVLKQRDKEEEVQRLEAALPQAPLRETTPQATPDDSSDKPLAEHPTPKGHKRWPSSPARVPKLLRTLHGHTRAANSVAWSPDGATLASGSSDETIKLWNAATGENTATLTSDAEELAYIQAIAFSPDGKALVAGSSDNTIVLWDVLTAKSRVVLGGHADDVESVAYSPDGKMLASGSDDGTVRLWDVAQGKHLVTLNGHEGYVWAVAFSPDGRMVASGGSDGAVKLWDAAARKLLAELNAADEDCVFSLAFSPDGKTLAAGGCSRIVLWDVKSHQDIRRLEGHSADQIGEVSPAIRSVAFSPDGQTIASGSRDKTIKLWDVRSGRSVVTLEQHTGFVECVAFSPDGKILASASEDKTIALWDTGAK